MGDIFADMIEVLEMTRETFEQLVTDSLMKAVEIVKRILSETKLGVDQIDEVFQ
jgi:molecular chaperone DnaK (HSP70)